MILQDYTTEHENKKMFDAYLRARDAADYRTSKTVCAGRKMAAIKQRDG